MSTREVEAVVRQFDIESLSSAQVSRAARLLDDELEAWRNRPLGEVKYLILDARYEKMRHGGVVRDAAVLSAIGVGPDERRRVLGVSVALSEAEVHWRAVPREPVVARGLRGVEVHRLRRSRRAARRPPRRARRRHVAALPVPPLAQNPHPSRPPHRDPQAHRGRAARRVEREARSPRPKPPWPSWSPAIAPPRRSWPHGSRKNVPEGLAVFTLPEHHRRRLRTSNPMERAVQQELKRRTSKVRVFPERGSPPAAQHDAILVEIDEKWASDTKAYIKWECRMRDHAPAEIAATGCSIVSMNAFSFG